MNLCIDNSNVVASSVAPGGQPSPTNETTVTSTTLSPSTEAPNSEAPLKPIAKLVQPPKVVNSPLITVLNSTGPLTVVKTLCVTSAVSSAPQFTLVNSGGTSISGKAPTITLLNAPVTVVKNIVEKGPDSSSSLVTTSGPSFIENRSHNVFVKNTCPDSTVPDVPQSHKLLTASHFPAPQGLNPIPKTINGQRNNKLKILSNVIVPPPPSTAGSSQQPPSMIINKQQAPQQQRGVVPRHKMIGGPPKFINKPTLINNLQAGKLSGVVKDKGAPASRMLYPTHKSQIKTMPPGGALNTYVPKVSGIKTLAPQVRPHPAQMQQRTGPGLRTIPPQRPPKVPNKLNYIGKHAVQAQKVKLPHHGKYKMKPQPPMAPYNSYQQPPVVYDKHLTFNQALTAEILETLSSKSSYPSKNYEILPNRYENVYQEHKAISESSKQHFEDKSKSGLDALSLICQAVLLDHNYNATMPDPPPVRSPPVANVQSQVNGLSSASMFSPKRGRSMSSSNTLSSNSSLSSISLNPQNPPLLTMTNQMQRPPLSLTIPHHLHHGAAGPGGAPGDDDDAASDISDTSDHKNDTEGEETDTAPEAEAVANDEPYGDYVTRCICGFLHDDGYMVECDRCKVWQHVQCVVKNRQVPDEFLCESCDPTKPVDCQKARVLQQQWLRDRRLLQQQQQQDPQHKLKTKELKNKEINFGKDDSDSSDAADSPQRPLPANNNTIAPSGKARTSLAQRRKAEKALNNTKGKRDPKLHRKQFKRQIKRVLKRKTKTQAHHAAASKTAVAEDTSDAFTTTHLPQLRQWIENYEEAVTNHYSPELRARISAIRVNGAQVEQPGFDFASAQNKCRVHTQPLTDIKYLVSTCALSSNAPVIELRGKYMLSTQHRNSGGGGALTTRQHAQRPGPFLFFYRMQKDNTEVCVDTRTYGNIARFIRRSCKPNAELRHCIEKGVLHLYLVTLTGVDKNVELTIKHESHDLASVGTTQIACYCNKPDECTINKSTNKKNGENEVHRKRRGRRAASMGHQVEVVPVTETKIKDELLSPTVMAPPSPTPVLEEVPVAAPEVKEIEPKKEEPLELKSEETKKEDLEIKEEPMDTTEPDEKEKPVEIKKEEPVEEPEESVEESPIKDSPIATRRSSNHHKEDKDDKKDTSASKIVAGSAPATSSRADKAKNKKLSREERKLEAILRAIEQMEKADQRKQEHKQHTKQPQHRRESEPAPERAKEEDKTVVEPKQKRKRRKGRARTTSTHSNRPRRDRLNSGDSSYLTSGDENLLSPNDGIHPRRPSLTNSENSPSKAARLLLALTQEEKNEKSPTRDTHHDSNSNSMHSSPETPMSLACSLVQAAVEPLEPGFKFPKTKKGLMNEWLNKGQDLAPIQRPNTLVTPVAPSEFDNNSSYYSPSKSLSNLAQAAAFCDQQPRGSAKKRWLRQAISEDKGDSPQSRSESPPLSDAVAPPKKRRLPRVSISNDNSPPLTPTSTSLAEPNLFTDLTTPTPEGAIDLPTPSTPMETDPQPSLPLEAPLIPLNFPQQPLDYSQVHQEELRLQEQQETPLRLQVTPPLTVAPPLMSPQPLTVGVIPLVVAPRPELPLGCVMDPRIHRDLHMFSNSDHLVGTVEKTLSIFGFGDRKPEPITPAKRKLSITEYLQRKKLNNNDNGEKNEDSSNPEDPTSMDDVLGEDNNSSESYKAPPTALARARSNSTTSSTSTTTDDEAGVQEVPDKVVLAPPAFNSEPTELERTRELSNMRLKKAFGLPMDTEIRKPALDVEAILNCDLPPVLKPSLPSPNFPIPGASTIEPPKDPPELTMMPPHDNLSPINSPPQSPLPETTHDVVVNQPEVRDVCEAEMGGAKVEVTPIGGGVKRKGGVKSHLFYTPDEEEDREEEEEEEEEVAKCSFADIGSVGYVPPFNNPVYPGINYTSIIDEDGRYEGRNPSPPPNLEL